MKLTRALLAATCALSLASVASAQTSVTWVSPVNVSTSDGAITKTGGCDGCPDAGAFSAAQLTGDGYVEFVPGYDQRFFAGLGADLSSSTGYATINYAFSFWPGGSWEVRELGLYKTDGTFAAGDRFRVAVENGVVVYRKNGAVVYTSGTAVYPLVLDVSLLSPGSSLTQAVSGAVTTTVTPPPPPPPPPSGGGPTRVSVGPYTAVVDRTAYAKPALPALGPAGTTIVDPVFGSPIARVTDGSTRPGYPDRSYRTPSSPHQNAWSAAGSYFYVVSDDGSVLPFTFDAATGTARRLQASASGNGGQVLSFYIEPQFSYVSDSIVYGSYSGSGATLHTIDQYDFTAQAYTRLLDLDAISAGLSGTYIGGLASSAGSPERIMAFYGGTSQDHHHLVVVFDRNNPQNRSVLDTWASTLNGAAAGFTLNFSLHHAAIDRTGRYVMLYPTSADQGSPRYASQSYLWDTAANTFTAVTNAMHPYGHDAFGYGVSVNQDCCTTTSWDAAQWQFRDLSAPAATRDVVATVLSPKEVYLSDHTTWNNARPDALVPYVSGLYRYGTNTTEWRAWDDEIVAVQTDAAPGVDPTVWRFAHHRTDITNDLDPTRPSFWYEPRPNVSHDGRWVLFTSNWEKTLGADPVGETGAGYRQDVFAVALTPADGSTPPPIVTPPPTVVPVAITTTALASGRATVAYAQSLAATGGGGTFAWSAAGLPSGLALDSTTGSISGTPATAGTFTVTVTVADAADPTNTASATYALAISAAVKIASPRALPDAKRYVAYTYTLQAANVVGTAAWSLAGGSLPPGMTLNAATGVISGTCTVKGMWSFNARVTDVSTSDTLTLTIKVAR